MSDFESAQCEKQELSVDRWIVHQNYRFNMSQGVTVNDIAVMKLKNRFNATEFVRPISLIPNSLIGISDTEIQGMGCENEIFDCSNHRISKFLKFKKMKKISTAECEKIPCIEENFVDSIPDKTFCAVGKRSGNGYKDSGSPLTIKKYGKLYLVGFLTLIFRCNIYGKPSIFTDVHAYKSFIRNSIRKLQTASK